MIVTVPVSNPSTAAFRQITTPYPCVARTVATPGAQAADVDARRQPREVNKTLTGFVDLHVRGTCCAANCSQ